MTELFLVIAVTLLMWLGWLRLDMKDLHERVELLERRINSETPSDTERGG